jgi:hypothetical protein
MKKLLCILACAVSASLARAGNYQNFGVAVYIPVTIVKTFADPKVLQSEWDLINSQVKVDKVYIEVHRDRILADDQLLEDVKAFFVAHGVQVAAGSAFSDMEADQFKSFCYTNAADREFVKKVAERAARHFDEFILDDFFFVNTKTDSDIAAKGDRSWTDFRLALMDDAGANLILKGAKDVNPKIKVVIKYPNWYEHFQGLGFDLDKGPKMFDGIYTGTETRDPVFTDQFLQQYESYQIIRYFENIKPGGNGGDGSTPTAPSTWTATRSSSGTRCSRRPGRSRSSTGASSSRRLTAARGTTGRTCRRASTSRQSRPTTTRWATARRRCRPTAPWREPP